MHLSMHAEILQCLNRRPNAGERRLTDVFDKDILRCGGAALHTVKHHDIGTGLHSQCSVIIGTCAADFDIDRLLPVSELAQFKNLDFEIVRPGPVRMPAGRTLVDALGQRAHCGDAVRNLLAEQHTAATGLGALSDHNFDRVGTAQVARVHAVAGRQILIHENLRMAALFLCHAAVACRGRRAGERRATPERFLGIGRERAKTHASDSDWNFKLDRLFGKAGSKRHRSVAAFTIAFERITRNGSTEKQQIVEMRHPALRASAADIVNPGSCRAADFGQRVVVECRGLARRGRRILIAHNPPSSICVGIVDVEIIELSGGAIAFELVR